MNEAAFWSNRLRPLIVRSARRVGVRSHLERIENMVGTGTPDVDYCVDGCPGKLELKYASDPARPTTPVMGRGNGMRRSQIVWACRRMYCGGRVLLCVGTPTTTYLLRLENCTPEDMRGLDLFTGKQLEDASAWCSRSGTARGLISVLTDTPPPYVMGAPTLED